jgi:putative transposase
MRGQRQVRGDWSGLVQQQQASGLSVLAFCRQEGVSSKSFYRHRQRCRQGAVVAPVGFVELRPVAAPPPVTGVAVVVGEWRVEVAAGFDPQTLRRVCACLRPEAACLA